MLHAAEQSFLSCRVPDIFGRCRVNLLSPRCPSQALGLIVAWLQPLNYNQS